MSDILSKKIKSKPKCSIVYCMAGYWSSGVVATKKVLRSTPQENSVLFLDPTWWGDSPRVKKLLQTNKMNISNKTCRTKSLKRLVINVWILPNFYSWLQRNMIISPMCPVPVLCGKGVLVEAVNQVWKVVPKVLLLHLLSLLVLLYNNGKYYCPSA